MKMGKVPILDTINKVPGGLMVIPLILGVLANTFFPDALQIGSFTTALFKSGANCLIGLLFFCSGAQIQFKSAGMSLYKGVVINLGKVLTGVACGGEDAAAVAQQYGAICALLYPFIEWLRSVMTVDDRHVDLNIGCAFDRQESEWALDFRLTFSLRLALEALMLIAETKEEES